jgi:hypothetical protein
MEDRQIRRRRRISESGTDRDRIGAGIASAPEPEEKARPRPGIRTCVTTGLPGGQYRDRAKAGPMDQSIGSGARLEGEHFFPAFIFALLIVFGGI